MLFSLVETILLYIATNQTCRAEANRIIFMISFESTTISNEQKLPAINMQSFFKHSLDILQTFAITLKSNWKPLYEFLLNLWASYPTGLHSIGIVGRLTRWRMPGYLSRRIITTFQECSKDSVVLASFAPPMGTATSQPKSYPKRVKEHDTIEGKAVPHREGNPGPKDLPRGRP